jgi:hypothetical protein
MIAGVDIGNSTTELAIWDERHDSSFDRVTVARQRTRGQKGSERSLIAAADLLARVERRHGLYVDAIAVCELAPAQTLTLDPLGETHEQAGAVRLDRVESSTPGGGGSGAGVHVHLHDLDGQPRPGPVVVSVPADAAFAVAAAAIDTALSRGWEIVGALVERDEGVLVANRLSHRIPVVDEVDLARAPQGGRVAVEVVEPGNRVAVLGDPLKLSASLGLDGAALRRLTPLARSLAEARSGAVALADVSPDVEDMAAPRWHLEYLDAGGEARTLDRFDAQTLEAIPPGAARRLVCDDASGDPVGLDVSDVFALDLAAVAAEVRPRPGAVRLDATMLATLGMAERGSVAGRLAELTGRPASTAGAESLAARRGALTTPGAPASANVCDLGGGTVDLIGRSGHTVVAGAGELLTSAVSYVLGISRIAAEYVKRGQAVRMESELLATHESGERVFQELAAPMSTVSWLCARGPGRLLPFSTALAPGDWRALRLALKQHVIGANIRRCLGFVEDAGTPLLLCGGAALDDELVAAVTDALHASGVSVSRADVAGRLGPRYAVALGAALSLPTSQEDIT